MNQGLWGALEQYWTVEPKARLNRRNSWLNDHQVSNYDAFKFSVAISVLATAIVLLWSLMGVLL